MGCDHSKNDGRTAGDNRRLNIIQQKKEEIIENLREGSTIPPPFYVPKHFADQPNFSQKQKITPAQQPAPVAVK